MQVSTGRKFGLQTLLILCLKYKDSFSAPLKTPPLVLIYSGSRDQQTWRHMLTAFDGSCQKSDAPRIVQDVLAGPLQLLQQLLYGQSSRIPSANLRPCCLLIFHSFFLQVYLVDTILEIRRKQRVSGECSDRVKFQVKNEADSMREHDVLHTDVQDERQLWWAKQLEQETTATKSCMKRLHQKFRRAEQGFD